MDIIFTIPRRYTVDPNSVAYFHDITSSVPKTVDCWPTGRIKREYHSPDKEYVKVEVLLGDGRKIVVPIEELSCVVTTDLK